MAPHATDSPSGVTSNGHEEPVNNGAAPLEPGIKSTIAQGKMMEFPRPPKFDDKYRERDYLKGRLAAAFRVRTSISKASPPSWKMYLTL